MASGSFVTLQKNLVASVGGFARFFAAAPQAFATWKKIKDRQWELAPQPVKDQAEVWEHTMWKRHLCQRKNMWVDLELNSACTREEIAQLMHYKMDTWRMAHWGMFLPVLGGYTVIPWIFWFGNNTWVPSTFKSTPEDTLEWRKDQDLYRYKHAPAMLAIERWFYEYFCQLKNGHKFDNIFSDKNDIPRNPEFGAAVAKGVDELAPFSNVRRKQIRAMARAMGIPTFPTFGKICLQARVRDYWELAFNEDVIVIKGNLHKSMSFEELQDYAWRRFLSPYDKELTHEQVLKRVEDYLTFVNYKNRLVEEGYTPNIFITIDYCLSHYNDPAFLDAEFEELDQNDFDHLKNWGKDAFLRRLEFENGPLRDQVEAQSIKKLAERQKKLEA